MLLRRLENSAARYGLCLAVLPALSLGSCSLLFSESSSAPDGSTKAGDATTDSDVDAVSGFVTTFVEQEGYIIMEMESAEIPPAQQWLFENNSNDLGNYSGEGYYRFTGNELCSSEPKDPLRYEFTTTTDQSFELRLRAASITHCFLGLAGIGGECSGPLSCDSLGETMEGSCGLMQCIRSDISSDSFVHIENAAGEYVSFVNQPASFIRGPVRLLFDGVVNSWGWTEVKALDVGNQKSMAAYWDLRPGVYTLVIQGGRVDFRIDRIALFGSEGSVTDAEGLPETRASQPLQQ